MIRLLNILIICFLISCNASENQVTAKKIARTDTTQNDMINYDTLPNGIRLLDNVDSGMHLYYREVVGSDTLKGGYITCYGIDDSAIYFYLRHGDTLHLLNKIPKNTTTWSVGILEKDLPIYFITMIDNGNGFPATYQVFDKKTAKNLISDNGEACDYKYLGDTLFFLYKEADSIFLYNARTGKREGFKLPKEHLDRTMYYEFQYLKKHSLTISYWEPFIDNDDKFLKYRRRSS